ncbi:DUF4405 domain-containing protein [Pelosinus fermentans]|uniref:Flavinylation-associated cytochrome domain-containing protein n=1 Tax=Pelosinus fermentans JBW45 TaxID=1192197 RepID=I9NKT8_9FIRM|nr:DUF4405 domain-containing protein [Pelosinus fermentans]AJQ29086.1 protein of unknown function DUF4405 [Pelosinus fermentans JBW45]
MRRITSIILMIAFIILSVSGVQMAVVPKPQNVQQQMLGNHGGDKSIVRGKMPFYPKKAHEWVGFVFIGAGLVHIVLNRKLMLSYLEIGRK